MPDPQGAAPLIAAKLRMPTLPASTADRPRLISILARAVASPLTLIMGPPGSGKSVALQQWLGDDPARRFAWVSLDERDDVPIRFWRYLTAGFAEAGICDLSETLAVAIERGGAGEATAATFLHEIDAIEEPVVIVLDDLHSLRAAEILEQLELIIDRLPPHVRVVATSRTEPALPLGRWRTRGQLSEIRQHDLAFTHDETASFLAAFDDLEISDEDMVRIEERTEGWAAGIQLVALAAQQADDVHAAVQSFGGDERPVASFFTTELLARQPADVREFLLDTCILSTLDTELCNAVTARSDAFVMLRHLETAQLFVVRIPGSDQFRYHQLFAEVLGLELQAADPDGSRRRRLHRRAAAGLGARGDVIGQVHHLIDADERDEAFEVAIVPSMDLWDRGEAAESTLELTDAFPKDYVAASADRIIPYVIALAAASQWHRISPWLDLAEAGGAHLDTAIARMTLHLVNGDGEAALAVVEQGAAVAARATTEIDPRLRARLEPHIGRAHLLIDAPERARVALEAIASDDPLVVGVIVPAIMSRVALRVGELHAAEWDARRAFTAAEELRATQHFALLDARLGLGGVLLDQNLLQHASYEIEAAISMAEQRRSPGYLALALLLQARLAAATHGLDDALMMVAMARRALEQRGSPSSLGRWLDALEARLRCESGAITEAEALVSTTDAQPARGLLEARIAITAGRHEHAVALLDGTELVRPRDLVEGHLLRARAMPGRTVGRTDAIEQALAIGAQHGFVRPFLDEGTQIAQLSEKLATASSSTRVQALGQLLATSELVSAPPTLMEPLTSREQQVLQYLPRPLTNQEIAAEIYVSLNTLKTHLRGLYRKLGATSRAECVARARALHLI